MSSVATDNPSSFAMLYRRLNSEQKRAVDAVEGPVMVIAGPGTGKTTVLTLRIANIIKQIGADPDSILALTFTDAAAFEMRERLVALMGGEGYHVAIHTFHGFCQNVLERHPEHFPHIVGFRPIIDIDQLQILREVVEGEDLRVLRPLGDPLHHVYTIKSALSEIKKENIDADLFAASVRDQEDAFAALDNTHYEKGPHKGKMKGVYRRERDEIAKNKELSMVYSAYQKLLDDRRLYDYDDMIMRVVRALEENDDLKLTLQEQYHYLLADEHQDANQAQNRLLELLTDFHESPNLFIVGDDRQAIFRFQGASLENFYYFHKKFPSALLVALSKNYRSTQSLLDAATHMIANNVRSQKHPPDRLEGRTTSSTAPSITVVPCATPAVERMVLRDRIERALNDGVAPSEIAVLVRTNAEVDPLARTLERAEIPYVLSSKQDVFAHPLVQQVFALFRAIREPDNDEAVLHALFSEALGFDARDVASLARLASRRGVSVGRVLSGADVSEDVRAFYAKIKRWRSRAEHEPLLVLAETVLEEAGIVAFVLSSAVPTKGLALLHALFDTMREAGSSHSEYRLHDFISYLDVIERHNVAVKRRLGGERKKGVQLMTAHSAKGREFDRVFIVNAVDGNWGGRRTRNYFAMLPLGSDVTQEFAEQENDDDERRLMYVAITRAREAVFVSRPRVRDDGKEQMPSRFLEEIPKGMLSVEDPVLEEALTATWEMRAVPKKPVGRREALIPFVEELFDDRGLSVTALNNFLECPWRYFFMNLVQIPKTPEPHMLFGTAVHAALQRLFERVGQRQDPGVVFLLDQFEHDLRSRWIDPRTIEEYVTRGRDALEGYYKKYSGSWVETVVTEFSLSNVRVDDIPLRGKLDKLEILNAANEVNVVDYKTGKPKSRNAIEGNTKGADGGIKRQIVFYKLLLDETGGPYFFKSGTIDFIEPADSGKYRRELFEVGEDEVRDLKVIIKETASAIRALSFWDDRCGDSSCEYCRLRDLMA